jgi:hypothetical protein
VKDFNDTKIYQVLYINFKYVGVDARILYNPSKAVSVAWGNEYIPGILKTLDEQQTRATFFFDGS